MFDVPHTHTPYDVENIDDDNDDDDDVFSSGELKLHIKLRNLSQNKYIT